MTGCTKRSKKSCASCKHCDYCDKAKLCDGSCHLCDITDCENNSNYKENENEIYLFN